MADNGGPEGAHKHVVAQGECLSSIAAQYGLAWSRIWNLPENNALRTTRKNPNVLFPGDVVHVPAREVRDESRSTEKRHRFMVKGVPVKLRLRLLAASKPLANEPYTLTIDGRTVKGTTDGRGEIDETIPASAESGVLILTKDKVRLELDIGHLDPITELHGVQARLHNIGYFCGDINGELTPVTRTALLAFQETSRLRATGEPDAATRDKLLEKHGC
jgi:Putative peptidoglycan binding domain/LysM domain